MNVGKSNSVNRCAALLTGALWNDGCARCVMRVASGLWNEGGIVMMVARSSRLREEIRQGDRLDRVVSELVLLAEEPRIRTPLRHQNTEFAEGI